MSVFTIELGSTVKSKVTGLKGVVTSRSECLNGCNRYYVQPKANKDMKVPDGWWMDEADLVVQKVPIINRANQDRGGPSSRVR
ncbi:MAG: hypothetical protein JXR97_12300 [Planctomycetes bacterium]|nr:hypothetical protein [Planctomycetota bacterium]